MNYRPEIDGLRAIAVLSVILSHANFTAFSGGFIGVDVFFVISGYLITRIILSEHAKGSFSLVRFYERRARRILPALFFVLLCTIPFAWFWLLPEDFERYSKSLIASTFSVSNIYFLRASDYFAPEAAELPLLHTWSLGVEEQFYLLFPLLFLFRMRVKTIAVAVATIAVASLVLSEFGSRHFSTANYYLLPTRAWEILAGSICAFYVSGRERPTNPIFTAMGFGCILASVALFDPSMKLPSLVALLPVGGTALFLVFSSSEQGAGRLLASTPLVWIGRISFSAYLWHQPVFAFWRVRSPEPPTTLMMAGLVVLTLVLAALSWLFVEERFRHRKGSLRRLVLVVTISAVSLGGFGAWGDLKEGLPFRLPLEVRRFVERTTWSRTCLFQVEDGMPSVPDEKCIFATPSGKNYAVWGDSIIASLSPAIRDQLASRDIGLMQITHGFCAPIRDVVTAGEEGAVNCKVFNDRALDALLSSNIDTVILGGSWVNFFNAPEIEIAGQRYAGDKLTVSELAAPLRRTIEELQGTGKRVIIVYPHPRFKTSIMPIMAKEFMKGLTAPDLHFPRADFKANTARATAILDAAVPAGVEKVFPEAIFCGEKPDDACYFGRAGAAFIADRGHFTYAGAELVAAGIMRVLDGSADTLK